MRSRVQVSLSLLLDAAPRVRKVQGAKTGCSSARLEYTSGGRVVAGSNPVTPTKLSRDSRTFVLLSFFILRSSGNYGNNGNYGRLRELKGGEGQVLNKTLWVTIGFFGFRGYPRRGYDGK